MDREHIDKLMHDIQQYLREEDRKKEDRENPPPPVSPSIDERLTISRPTYLEFVLLLSACATAMLTVAVLVLIMFSGQSSAFTRTLLLLSSGGCGIFFTAVLISIWKRLALLSQIEENTRLILASKLEGNMLLERLMHK